MKEGDRVRIRQDARLEELRFRGLTGALGKTLSTGLVWFRPDRMTDGFLAIIVHPESLEEIV
jgi:hypothetical protein